MSLADVRTTTTTAIGPGAFRADPKRSWVPWVITAASLAIVAGSALGLPPYLVFVLTSVLVAMVSLVGLGVVTGTAGMIALCQLSFAAIGAWVLEFLLLRTPIGDVLGGAAFVVSMIAAALVAAAFGILVGLPALRLRGVNLAVITLGVAAATDMTMQKLFFPDQWANVRVPRPFGIPFGGEGDRFYLVFTAVVVAIVALSVLFLQSSRLGASWRAVAFSERGTASAGTSVTSAKLTAFGVSAFVGGIAGALTVGHITQVSYVSFQTINSLGLYVLSVAVGTHLIEMALLGGILFVAIPEILKQFGVPLEWANLAYAVLGIQALTTNSNLGNDIRLLIQRRRRRLGFLGAEGSLASLDPVSADLPRGDDHIVLAVKGLAVHYGAVKALTKVDVDVRRGEILGLIGPNGAGKSTFVDAISGFVSGYGGSVRLDGKPLDGLPPHERARAGLRRTFQQDRVPATMTVGAYARFVSRGQADDAHIDEALAYFGCPPSRTPLQLVDGGTRRLVEVAANLAANPVVLLLDEPAAGLSHEEHLAFADRLRGVPKRFGVTLVIIEHDLDLVRSVCANLAVLDFGEVLASGPQDEVLSNPAVLKAYMGEMEMP